MKIKFSKLGCFVLGLLCATLLWVWLSSYIYDDRKSFGKYDLVNTFDDGQRLLYVMKNDVSIVTLVAQRNELRTYVNVTLDNQIDPEFLTYFSEFDGDKVIESGWIGRTVDNLDFEMKDENFDGVPDKRIKYDGGCVIEEVVLKFEEEMIEPVAGGDRPR